MNLAPIDTGVIIVYLLILAAIGFFIKKRNTVSEYLLAGRRLTLPLFVVTLVSTWYGGLLGVGELSYNYGIVNWLTQGFFWYISYAFFAFFLAKKIRKSMLITLPDQLEKFYDKKSRLLGAFFNFIMVTPAPYILSIGIIVSLIFNWPVWIGVILGTLISILYTMKGGFMADVYTDFLQFILMCVGVAMIVPLAVMKYGGWTFLKTNLPASHLTLTGTWTTQMIIVWGFLAMWTLVDPGFYQRCYAAKNSKIPKKGILIAMGFWMLFDVCTTFIGMYARAAMPGIDPTTSFIVFANSLLPVFLKGLFLTGVIATIMSTIDSFTFVGATNLSHDIYKSAINKNASQKTEVRATRVGIVITGVFAMVLALFFKSIVAMWYTIGTIGISALLVPMMFGFFSKKKKHPLASFLSMIAGSLTSLFWLIWGYTHLWDGWPTYILNIEPMYPGLIMSLLTFIIINRMKK